MSRFRFKPILWDEDGAVGSPYDPAGTSGQLRTTDPDFPRVNEIFQDDNGNLFLHKIINGISKYSRFSGELPVVKEEHKIGTMCKHIYKNISGDRDGSFVRLQGICDIAVEGSGTKPTLKVYRYSDSAEELEPIYTKEVSELGLYFDPSNTPVVLTSKKGIEIFARKSYSNPSALYHYRLKGILSDNGGNISMEYIETVSSGTNFYDAKEISQDFRLFVALAEDGSHKFFTVDEESGNVSLVVSRNNISTIYTNIERSYTGDSYLGEEIVPNKWYLFDFALYTSNRDTFISVFRIKRNDQGVLEVSFEDQALNGSGIYYWKAAHPYNLSDITGRSEDWNFGKPIYRVGKQVYTFTGFNTSTDKRWAAFYTLSFQVKDLLTDSPVPITYTAKYSTALFDQNQFQVTKYEDEVSGQAYHRTITLIPAVPYESARTVSDYGSSSEELFPVANEAIIELDQFYSHRAGLGDTNTKFIYCLLNDNSEEWVYLDSFKTRGFVYPTNDNRCGIAKDYQTNGTCQLFFYPKFADCNNIVKSSILSGAVVMATEAIHSIATVAKQIIKEYIEAPLAIIKHGIFEKLDAEEVNVERIFNNTDSFVYKVDEASIQNCEYEVSASPVVYNGNQSRIFPISENEAMVITTDSNSAAMGAMTGAIRHFKNAGNNTWTVESLDIGWVSSFIRYPVTGQQFSKFIERAEADSKGNVYLPTTLDADISTKIQFTKYYYSSYAEGIESESITLDPPGFSASTQLNLAFGVVDDEIWVIHYITNSSSFAQVFLSKYNEYGNLTETVMIGSCDYTGFNSITAPGYIRKFKENLFVIVPTDGKWNIITFKLGIVRTANIINAGIGSVTANLATLHDWPSGSDQIVAIDDSSLLLPGKFIYSAAANIYETKLYRYTSSINSAPAQGNKFQELTMAVDSKFFTSENGLIFFANATGNQVNLNYGPFVDLNTNSVELFYNSAGFVPVKGKVSNGNGFLLSVYRENTSGSDFVIRYKLTQFKISNSVGRYNQLSAETGFFGALHVGYLDASNLAFTGISLEDLSLRNLTFLANSSLKFDDSKSELKSDVRLWSEASRKIRLSQKTGKTIYRTLSLAPEGISIGYEGSASAHTSISNNEFYVSGGVTAASSSLKGGILTLNSASGYSTKSELDDDNLNFYSGDSVDSYYGKNGAQISGTLLVANALQSFKAKRNSQGMRAGITSGTNYSNETWYWNFNGTSISFGDTEIFGRDNIDGGSMNSTVIRGLLQLKSVGTLVLSNTPYQRQGYCCWYNALGNCTIGSGLSWTHGASGNIQFGQVVIVTNAKTDGSITVTYTKPNGSTEGKSISVGHGAMFICVNASGYWCCID